MVLKRGVCMGAAALLFTLVLGCNTSTEEPPEPPAEPDVPRHFLRLGAIRANLPTAWEPVPDRALARMLAAGRQSDPEGRIEMTAVGIAGPSPDFSLTILDLSPSRSAGLSAQDTVRAMQRDLGTATAARGLTFAFEHTCEERHCDATYTVEGGGPRQENRVRVWRQGNQIHQRRCACVDVACSEMARCELPPPPPGAAAADAQTP